MGWTISLRAWLSVVLGHLIQGSVGTCVTGCQTHKGILTNTCGPKASNACSHIPQHVPFIIRTNLVPPKGESNSLFTKGCFPHRRSGFEEISDQPKGPPRYYGILHNTQWGSSKYLIVNREPAMGIYTSTHKAHHLCKLGPHLESSTQSASSKTGHSLPCSLQVS